MSLEHTKQRDIPHSIHHPDVERFREGQWKKEGVGAASDSVFLGKQITVSSGHRKGHDGRYHEGGPFFTSRIAYDIPTISIRAEGGTNPKTRYFGPVFTPLQSLSNFIGSSVATQNQDSSYLDPVGATAIHIIDPTNPNAQFGVAIGEILKDRYIPIPAIQSWRRRTEVAKAAGSEYLNAVFGWLPLVRDMKNTAQSVKDGNKIMENYQAASGTLVHREFSFDDIVSESTSIVSTTARATYSASSTVAALNAGGQPLIRTVRSTTKRWFSGSFTYHSGSGTDIGKCLGVGSEADKLFGLTLTPDVVWELTPWSWALDWFSNTGDVISNATSFGLAGLVMKYGYIMEETSSEITYSMPSSGVNGVTAAPPPSKVVITTKRRRPANPFGFGIGWEDLSPTQLAITAALGITRL
jgi:hypothetical protein